MVCFRAVFLRGVVRFGAVVPRGVTFRVVLGAMGSGLETESESELDLESDSDEFVSRTWAE